MAKKKISRAQFLRGDYRGNDTVMRPPWSISEQDFVEHCTRCGDCLVVCPEKILKPGRGGFPQIDFSKGECSFCQKCQQICTHDAFSETMQRPWFYHVEIGESCLSKKGVACMTCAEQCEAEAIRFIHRVGSVAQPQVHISECSGCGACYRSCPVAAIQFQQAQILSREQLEQKLEAYP